MHSITEPNHCPSIASLITLSGAALFYAGVALQMLTHHLFQHSRAMPMQDEAAALLSP